MNTNQVFLGLGSNVGHREAHLQYAISQLQRDEMIVFHAASTVEETEPVGNVEQGAFLNQVVQVSTSYSPNELLQCCLRIEEDRGRIRDVKWGPRTLDIDILFFGSMVFNQSGLTIPHPEGMNRSFVVEPMARLAPSFTHPISGETMLEHQASLQKRVS